MAQVGTGSTIEFVTSGVILDITGISIDGVSVPVIDSSHMLTATPGAQAYGARTKIPGLLAEPGTLKVECHRSTSVYALLGVVQTIRLTSGVGEDVEEASGFVSDISATYAMEGLEVQSLTIQRSGAVAQS